MRRYVKDENATLRTLNHIPFANWSTLQRAEALIILTRNVNLTEVLVGKSVRWIGA